eukprot:9168492-Prorocentrum_lima.AAC.1
MGADTAEEEQTQKRTTKKVHANLASLTHQLDTVAKSTETALALSSTQATLFSRSLLRVVPNVRS